MKKATLFLTLSLLLIAAPAFGQPDLIGTWCVYMSEAVSDSDKGLGILHEAIPVEFEITDQDDYTYGTLFRGFVYHGVDENGVAEYGYFSGVLDDKSNISITHWDSVTRGKLIKKGKHPLKIEFINNAFDADNRGAKTAIGEAIEGPCP